MNRREFLKLGKIITMAPLYSLPVQSPSTIQDLIDEAAGNGSTWVIVPPGVYPISETIQCAPGVGLDLSAAVLQAAEDVDIVRCAPQAHIVGARVDWSQVTPFTHSAFVLDGADHFGMTFPTRIQNVQILGDWQTEGETGTGVLMRAMQGDVNSFVFGVQMSNVSMSYMQYGLRMTASATSGNNMACVNGNQFANLNFAQCRNSIHMQALDWLVSVDGNTFTNVQVQPGAGAVRALYCEGDYNMISNLMVWDWTGQTAVEFAENTAYNKLSTDLTAARILDNGWNNQKAVTEP